jgi:biotin carboxyl carrier protein
MAFEVKIGNRMASVELLSREGSNYRVRLDGREMAFDAIKVEDGVYSLLFRNRSYNIEMIENGNPRKYLINTFFASHELEIIDAEARYMLERGSDGGHQGELNIISPMPGKVVKVFTSVGAEVKKGDTLLLISAMKMESEYKAKGDGTVSEVFVRDGDLVEGGQVLVVIE